MHILSMSRLVLFWKSRSVLGQWYSPYRERVRRFHNSLCGNCEVIWTNFSALTKTYNLLGHLLLQRWSLDRWRALQFSQSNCRFGILVWLSESVSRQRRNCRTTSTWSTIHIQVKYPIKNYYNNTIFLNSVLFFWWKQIDVWQSWKPQTSLKKWNSNWSANIFYWWDAKCEIISIFCRVVM